EAERIDEALIGLLLARRQRDLAVLGAEHAVRRDDRMVVAGAPRLFAGREIIGGEKRQEADQAVVEARGDRLEWRGATPGSAAADERGANAERAVQSGDEIGQWWAGPQRRAVRHAGHGHEAAHRLRDEIEGRAVAIGAARAEAADVAIDKIGL